VGFYVEHGACLRFPLSPSHAPPHLHALSLSKKIIKKIMVGEFNTLLTSIDRSSRQKISKETLSLNNMLGQVDLTDVYICFV